MQPPIEAIRFGEIVIAGQTFTHDVVITPDGRVHKRKKKLSKALYGTSHILSLDEAKETLSQDVELLIIGAGLYDRLRLSPEAQAYLEALGCKVKLLPTEEAIKRWNEAQGKVIGLFHITC